MERGAMQWLAAALAAGCVHAGGEAPVAKGEGPEAGPWDQARLEADLQRFAALELVAVTGIDQSDFPTNCYGMCNQTIEAQGPRMKTLADLAEQALDEPASCEGLDASQEVAALAELQIVTVTGLITEEAANNPNCYNLPCPEDIERAEAENCKKLGALAALNRAAKDL